MMISLKIPQFNITRGVYIMFKKCLLVLALVWGGYAHSKTLSAVILDENLKANQNYVFSNASIDGLLSLLSFGLSQSVQDELSLYWGGVSLNEKAQNTSALSQNVPGLIVSVNYQVWLHQAYDFLPGYKNDLSFRFSVVPEKMDIEDPKKVVSQVNTWAAQNTNNLIQEVIEEDTVTPDLISILTNAVYFKGEWDEKFEKSLTQKRSFNGANLVDTMHKENALVRTSWDSEDEVVVIELPFKGKTHSLIIAMSAQRKFDDAIFSERIDYNPSKDVKTIFEDYIVNAKAFTNLELNSWEQDYRSFTLPKFEIESDIQGIESKLSQLGLTSLFEPGALSNMIDDPRAQLSKVFQKAKIIVNEEGAEAAAVSVGTIILESAMVSQILNINGPFAYVIRDNTSQVNLFEGVVLNP